MTLVDVEGASPAVTRVLGRVGDAVRIYATKGHDWWVANCPAHQDTDGGLTIRQARDGRAVLECAAKCRPGAVAAALGLTMRELHQGGSADGAGADGIAEDVDESDEPSRFRLLTVADLADLPPVTWLADGVLPAGGLAALYGAPGSAKSFVALGLVCAVAAGVPWLGIPVRRGAALYFAAEGTAGLPQRVAAWVAAHPEAELAGARFVAEPVNLMQDVDVVHVARAVAAVRRETGLPPGLVVVDTLARSMPGGDENDTPDMNGVLARAARIQRATGASVLLVHHTRKDSDAERGSTALRGAVDALVLCKADDGNRRLTCEKQKDAPPFEPIPFTLTSVTLGHGDGPDAPATTSCVATRETPEAARPDALTPHMRAALLTLRRSFLEAGASCSDWGEAVTEEHRISVASFYRARTQLVRAGYVTDPGGARGGKYALTPTGRYVVRAIETGDVAALDALPALDSHSLSGRSHDSGDAPGAGVSRPPHPVGNGGPGQPPASSRRGAWWDNGHSPEEPS